MARRSLSQVPVGATIQIHDDMDGLSMRPWIVVRHNYRGTGHTLMLRKNPFGEKSLFDSKGTNTYIESTQDVAIRNHTLHGYYPGGWGNLYGTIMPAVSIISRRYDGSIDTMSRAIFALSAGELGQATGDGPDLGLSAANKIAYNADNGNAQLYWLRSVNQQGDGSAGSSSAQAGYCVDKNGNIFRDNQKNKTLNGLGNQALWYRPAVCLRADTVIDYISTTSLSNNLWFHFSPPAPASITVNGGNSILAGNSYSVNWSSATFTDPDGSKPNVIYNLEVSYNGGAFQIVASGITGTAYTHIVPNSGSPGTVTSVRYRVRSYANQCESATSVTSTTVQVINNSPPTTPPSITVATLPLQKGGEVTVSWGASTDPDNNLSGYKLEQSLNGGSWTQVYSGPNRTWSGTLGSGTNTVQYRVKAFDTYNAESSYRSSTTYTLQDPEKTTVAQHSNSGIKGGQTYTTDIARSVMFSVANNKDPNMTAKYTTRLTRNGVLVESKTNVVITGGVYTYAMTKRQWQTILNGGHTYALTVTSASGVAGSANIAFTKNISRAIIKSEPFAVEINSGIIKNFLINVAGKFPAGSILTVQITNNAKDTSPVWQNVELSQLDGGYHPINNLTVANGNWFAVRVTTQRGTATDTRWISQISGMAGLSQTFILAEDNKHLREDFDTKALKLLGSVTNYASLPTAPDIRLVGGIWKANDTDKYWSWTGDAWIEVLREFDTAPIQGSANGITSGGVFAALENGLAGVLKPKGTVAKFTNLPPTPAVWDMWETADDGREWYWNGSTWKELGFTIVMDGEPTSDSTNFVSSGAIYDALQSLDINGILSRLDAIEAALADTAGALDPANP